MPRTRTYEAIVLKTYDIGDADRFCILLTREEGRVTACAKGVRKLKSKWSGCIQSFQHITVELNEHSSGLYLKSAQCTDSFSSIRSDVERFNLASKGAEILLKLLHDSEKDENIFDVSLEYFQKIAERASSSTLIAFVINLFIHLGELPHDAPMNDLHQKQELCVSMLRERQIRF